jgi:hypothetical protein
VEDKKFLERCGERNFAFIESIPNSATYWNRKKNDVFAMIRQLGKPTLFITFSICEYRNSDLLRIQYKLKHGKVYEGDDPVTELNSHKRTTLVNKDPVACCLYFNKLVDLLHTLKSKKQIPFGEYRVVAYFKRNEFQQRGSPHAHILLWLETDPKEVVGEDISYTVQLIDALICVDPES